MKSAKHVVADFTQRRKPPAKAGREAPKYLLRLPAEIGDQIRKEANLNGRSINSEIISRLQRSIEDQRAVRVNGYKVAEAGLPPIPPEQLAADDNERAMLAAFRRLSPERQLALLSLLK